MSCIGQLAIRRRFQSERCWGTVTRSGEFFANRTVSTNSGIPPTTIRLHTRRFNFGVHGGEQGRLDQLAVSAGCRRCFAPDLLLTRGPSGTAGHRRCDDRGELFCASDRGSTKLAPNAVGTAQKQAKQPQSPQRLALHVSLGTPAGTLVYRGASTKNQVLLDDYFLAARRDLENEIPLENAIYHGP